MEKITKQTLGGKVWNKAPKMQVLDMQAFNLKWYDYLYITVGSIILVLPLALLLTIILQ